MANSLMQTTQKVARLISGVRRLSHDDAKNHNPCGSNLHP
jgi:hypothetical protein